MRSLRLPFLFFITLTIQFSGLAQQSGQPAGSQQRIRFEHLTVADGLPENSFECMLQDHLGFIWLGTQGGLARYDGTTLVSYQYDPQKPNTLKGGLIKALYEDRNGDIWIGCESLFRYERATGRFIEYPQNSPEKMGQRVGFINFIKEDKQGNLWTITVKDQLQTCVLDRLNPRTKAWTYFRHNPKDSHSLANNGMYWNTINSIPDLSFAEDATGKIWVVTESPEGQTLHWFDQQTGRFTRYTPPAALTNAFKEITAISIVKQHLYLSSNHRGLFRLNLQTGQLDQLTHQSTQIGTLTVESTEGEGTEFIIRFSTN